MQLGIEGELRIAAAVPWVELLLSRLRTGFRRTSFDVIAHGVGAPREEARTLLARIEHLLVDDPVAARPAWVETIGVTDGRSAHRAREVLEDEGVALVDRTMRGATGVILVQGAAAAMQFARYLRDDIPHLPIAFEPGRVSVGPLVIPGRTPCLSCRDAADTDRDPAWPLLHAQLIGQGAGPLRAGRIAEGAVAASRLLVAGDGGTVAQISEDGSRASRAVSFHEGCRCREQSSPSPRGTATEPALLALPTAPTRSPRYARRA
ncbi:hypothetical protein RS85_02660 [Microbacterium sp. SA39]|nr:hypothetical protein RS85_02660 [Microbacterium sp. SA39]